MILFAVFLTLATAWIFWGWMVGESREIRWMKRWCATIFVSLAILICLGAGAGISRRMTKTQHSDSVRRLTQLLHERMKEGRTDDVRDALQHLAEDPAEGSSHSPDVLTRLSDVTEALQKTVRQ
jgi:hypothetical protein